MLSPRLRELNAQLIYWAEQVQVDLVCDQRTTLGRAMIWATLAQLDHVILEIRTELSSAIATN